MTVGEAPSFALVAPRKIRAERVEGGAIRAHLYKGMAGDAVYMVTEYMRDVRPDGSVVPVAAAVPGEAKNPRRR